MIDYSKNYAKIYIWQAISILLGFASLFVVVPFISSNKILFGVYSVCTSLTIFFSYADLGFLSVCVKYASECFVRNEKDNEIKVVGFTTFIMGAIFMIIALGVVILAIFPQLLIPELTIGSDMYNITRSLLMILAISCPIIICQRILDVIYSVRVENFKYQRIAVVGSAIKILSVLYFFTEGHYRLVEYYTFLQIVSFCVVIVNMIYIRKYGYSVSLFIKSIRYDSVIFSLVRKLGATSLVITLANLIYYEFDQVAISNLLGIEAVAIYGVAKSLFQLTNTFCSLVYSPYISRYNHFVGLNDYQGLCSFVNRIIEYTAPIISIPLICLSLNSKPFIISWVGEQYVESSIIAVFLVLNYVANFIRDPISSYFVATENNMKLLMCHLLLPIIFWIGVIFTVHHLGLVSFALFKVIAPYSCSILYWIYAKKDFERRGYSIVKIEVLLKELIPGILMVFLLTYFFGYIVRMTHTTISLCINLSLIVLMSLLGVGASMLFNKRIRAKLINIKNK